MANTFDWHLVPVKRRVKALKKLQQADMEVRFAEDVHGLESRYRGRYAPLYNRSRDIVISRFELGDRECDWTSDTADKDEDLAEQLEENVNVNKNSNKSGGGEKIKGIPDFWLIIFKNISLLSNMVQDYDEPILKHLIDIKTIYSRSPMGFTLEFHFSPNKYFKNSVLIKEYEMNCAPQIYNAEMYIYNCRGCTIYWNKGKNVTLRSVRNKRKHRNKNSKNNASKTVEMRSFFNFFAPKTLQNSGASHLDEEMRSSLLKDFEIGYFIKERIVPRAVLYFTGELVYDESGKEYGGKNSITRNLNKRFSKNPGCSYH